MENITSMPLYLLLLLSLVQGFAEFVPVSSAAHLMLIERWFGSRADMLVFDLALNLGTLLTILVYFKNEVILMFKECWSLVTLRCAAPGNTLLIKVIVSAIPVTICGLIFSLTGFTHIVRSLPLLLTFCLMVFGIILYLADKLSKSRVDFPGITVLNAFCVGLAQCLALIPGVSRSGITITAARLLNINRRDAVKFSFLMAIPSTLGAVLYTGVHSVTSPVHFHLMSLILGTFFSFAFGMMFVRFLLKYLAEHNFLIFMIYRLLLGAVLVCTILFKLY